MGSLALSNASGRASISWAGVRTYWHFRSNDTGTPSPGGVTEPCLAPDKESVIVSVIDAVNVSREVIVIKHKSVILGLQHYVLELIRETRSIYWKGR